MSLDTFLARLRVLDSTRANFNPETDYIAQPENGGGGYSVKRASYVDFGAVLEDEFADLPDWLKSSINDTKIARVNCNDVKLGLLAWLAKKGHTVFGPDPKGKMFGRVADAIAFEEFAHTVREIKEVELKAMWTAACENQPEQTIVSPYTGATVPIGGNHGIAIDPRFAESFWQTARVKDLRSRFAQAESSARVEIVGELARLANGSHVAVPAPPTAAKSVAPVSATSNTAAAFLAALDDYHNVLKAIESVNAIGKRCLVDGVQPKRQKKVRPIDQRLLDGWKVIQAQTKPFGRMFPKARPLLAKFVREYPPQTIAGTDLNYIAVATYKAWINTSIQTIRAVVLEADMFGTDELPADRPPQIDAELTAAIRDLGSKIEMMHQSEVKPPPADSLTAAVAAEKLDVTIANVYRQVRNAKLVLTEQGIKDYLRNNSKPANKRKTNSPKAKAGRNVKAFLKTIE